MSAPCYIAFNGAAGTTPFTDFPVAVTTGTSTSVAKTMIQIKPGTPKIRVIEWGYSFDATPAAPVKVALGAFTCSTLATVTAFNAADVMKYNDATGAASQVSLSTTASGFTASAEGTITAERLLSGQHDASQMFKQQFPLGREPEVNGGDSLRIRVTMGSAAALNMVCYIVWEE